MSAPGAGYESRRTPRRVFNRTIGVLRHGEYGLSQALQLSEGGLLFECEEKLSEKEPLVVSLVLPGGDCVVARGEIVYQRPGPSGGFHSGVKFNGLALHQKRMIRNYVSAKTQKEAESEVDDG